MELFKWSEKYSVNIQKIDDQHKKLFELVNSFNKAIAEGRGNSVEEKVLSDLITYARAHFYKEENLFEKYLYPDYLKHKEEHDKFIKQVLDFKKQLMEGKTELPHKIFHFLKNWLTNHILIVDKRDSSFLNSRGDRGVNKR